MGGRGAGVGGSPPGPSPLAPAACRLQARWLQLLRRWLLRQRSGINKAIDHNR